MGIVPGYGSPIGVTGAKVIVDHSIVSSPNLIAGANKPDIHLKNVNYEREYSADVVADIAAAAEGYGCPSCAKPMRASRGVEVGNIFQLGTKYTEALGSAFLDAEGKSRSVIMGSYGIGVGRLLACIAEENHDESGLVWPISVAPFQVVIVSLARKEGECQQVAEQIYNDLKENGIEVLFDDRKENPGVKFKDADLIGIPIRLTVGDRGIKNGVIELNFFIGPSFKPFKTLKIEKTFQNKYPSKFQLISALSSKSKEQISSDVNLGITEGVEKMINTFNCLPIEAQISFKNNYT